jgi:uncharacterized membrane protein
MTSGRRREYIDWARGLAVLLMIEAHTIDAWTRARDKHSLAYGYGTIVGGFAAPLFLWLAGVGVAMSMARTLDRTNSRREALRAATKRGAEIFLLAFLFRLQAFVVSPGGPAIALFRVDVLNVMGPAMVVAGLLWVAARTTTTQVMLLTAAATAVALATPLVRAAAAVNHLPVWVQWYLRPAGEFTTFTMMPWSGFVFAGAAAGVLISAGSDERRTLTGLAIAGVALIAIGWYAAGLPAVYRVPVNFWTSSPTWFAIRAGIMMAAVAGLFWIPQNRWLEPLALMGRASLFIYWIHVELVYGYASWLWRHRLPLWGWAVGYTLFTALIYRAVGLRDRWLANRGRQIPAPAAIARA